MLGWVIVTVGDGPEGVTTASLFLLIVPLTLISCYSPFAVRLLLESTDTSGRQTGAVYGINTGFGKLASVKIAAQDVSALQRNLIEMASGPLSGQVFFDLVNGAPVNPANPGDAADSIVLTDDMTVTVTFDKPYSVFGTAISARRESISSQQPVAAQPAQKTRGTGRGRRRTSSAARNTRTSKTRPASWEPRPWTCSRRCRRCGPTPTTRRAVSDHRAATCG